MFEKKKFDYPAKQAYMPPPLPILQLQYTSVLVFQRKNKSRI